MKKIDPMAITSKVFLINDADVILCFSKISINTLGVYQERQNEKLTCLKITEKTKALVRQEFSHLPLVIINDLATEVVSFLIEMTGLTQAKRADSLNQLERRLHQYKNSTRGCYPNGDFEVFLSENIHTIIDCIRTSIE